MYKTHMGAQSLRTENTAGIRDIIGVRGEKQTISNLTSSASVKDGMLTVTVANTCHDKDIPLSLELTGLKVTGDGEITVLVGDSICAHNTFENPDRVTPKTTALKASEISNINVPAASVIAVRIPVDKD
jgi:alpha-N-arabinofuranosidase